MSKFVDKLNSIPSRVRLLAMLAILFAGSIILVLGKNETIDESQSKPIVKNSIETSSKQTKAFSPGKDGEHLLRSKNESDLTGIEEQELSISELEKKYKRHKTGEIIQLFSTDLSETERDFLEQLLADSQNQSIDKLLDGILHEGYLNLTTGGKDREDSVFQIAATNRLNSAIRVIGLRSNKEAVGEIIDIASHQKVKESTLQACYQALGTLKTPQAKSYLRGQLRKQKDPFLKSKIILSLTKAGSAGNTDLYLRLLRSYDTDLRNSAIVALGETGAEKAIEPFDKMFGRTSNSSKLLIIKALKKINTVAAEELLEKISDSYPDLLNDSKVE